MKRTVQGMFLERLQTQNDSKTVLYPSILRKLPNVTLWSSRGTPGDTVSDVSSLGSSVESRISHTDDSVSVMSSSDSSGSVISLDDAEKEPVRHIPYGSENFPSGTNQKTLYGDLLHLEEQLSSCKKVCEKFSVLSRLLEVQRFHCLPTVAEACLQNLNESHRLVCFFCSVELVLKASNSTDDRFSKRITEAFMELYSSLVSFYTIACENLCDSDDPKIRSILLESSPYVVDILYSILPSLLSHVNESSPQKELMSLFENVSQSCLLICCSLCDDRDELVRIAAAHALLRISLCMLPLEIIERRAKYIEELLDSLDGFSSSGPVDPSSLVTDEVRAALSQKLWTEYMKDEFKPVALLLRKLNERLSQKRSGVLGEAPITGKDNASKVGSFVAQCVIKSSVTIAEGALRTGCAKRQFPTSYLDPKLCTLSAVSRYCTMNNIVTQLWARVKFWLLLLLEDVNAEVRNYGLRIIKHVLCTLPFIERDRQHILSHVYDCLSEDPTFLEALGILSTVSHIYPMKDGAVRRVAMLTLKGSRSTKRLEVIEALGNCKFTPKGLEVVVKIFQALAEPLASDMGSKTDASYVTGSIVDSVSEVQFARTEWPVILKALQNLAKHHYQVDKLDTACSLNLVLSYVGRNRLCSLPASVWVQLLWRFMSEDVDEGWKLVKALWRSEARLRFPNIVSMDADDDEKILVKDSIGIITDFIDMDGITVDKDFITDSKRWNTLHNLRVPDLLDHLELSSAAFINTRENVYTGANVDFKDENEGNRCYCIDCRMDLAILNRQGNKESADQFPIRDYANECTLPVHNDNHDNNFTDFIAIEEDKMCKLAKLRQKCAFVMSRCYTVAIQDFLYETLWDNETHGTTALDDVDCAVFPAFLGSQVTIKMVCKLRKTTLPWEGIVVVKFPKVVRSSNAERTILRPIFNLSGYNENVETYTATVNFMVNFPFATVQPIAVQLVPCVLRPSKPMVTGNTTRIWIHPTPTLG